MIFAAYQYSPTAPSVLREILLLLTENVPLEKEVRDRLEADFNKRLSENSEQPLVHLLLGLVLLQGNRERPALVHLETAAKQDIQNSITLARVLRDRGHEAAAQQALERAVAEVGSAAKAKPQDLSLRMAWAETEMQLQHWTQAKQILAMAILQTKTRAVPAGPVASAG